MKKHFIRIVGGEYRRTPIPVVTSPLLRPTPDRVRETLFNWLQHLWSGNFSDKSVLDLFAGSGALGFEAASRGVGHVQMVENDPGAIKALRALRTKLNANQVRVHAGDADMVVQRMDASRFDLIMLDPPFGQRWFDKLWSRLPGIMTPEGLIYLESESTPELPSDVEIIRQGRAGNVHFFLVAFSAEQENSQ